MNKIKMFRRCVLLLTLTVGCLSFASAHKEDKFKMRETFGVWANQNCELVQTAKYTLIFHRQEDKITTILRHNKQEKESIFSEFVQAYEFDAKKNSYRKVTCGKKQQKVLLKDLIQRKNKNLKMVLNSHSHKLDLIEKIEVCDPYEMQVAQKGKIGKCLQLWQLGTVEHKLDPEDFWIEIGTNKHMYIFLANKNQLYCRAARIRSNEQGSVFAQNIRLMFSAYSKETTVSMSDDNLKTSQSDIKINNTLFKPDACSFENNGIYWSYISNTDNQIKLNGCGEVYIYSRPDLDDTKRVEWFTYRSY